MLKKTESELNYKFKYRDYENFEVLFIVAYEKANDGTKLRLIRLLISRWHHRDLLTNVSTAIFY